MLVRPVEERKGTKFYE